jgi:quercetin dioxygenase-like cupin family protein
MLISPDFRQTMFSMDAGQELSEHTSSFLAIVQVISGKLRMAVPGRELEMERDAWLSIPPHTPHAVHAIEPTRFLLTLVRVPVVPKPGA